MNGNRVAGVLAGLLVLSACGGGGGSGGSPTGGSGGTPTPSPTSTPTPTVSYTPYAQLTGNQSFDLMCQVIEQRGVNQIAAPIPLYADPGLTLSYDETAQSYRLTGFGVDETFGPGDADPTIPGVEKAYAKTNAENFTARLIIGAPAPGGTAADYTRGLFAFVENENTGYIDTYSCAFGLPTALNDQPAQTQVSFTAFDSSGTINRFYPDGTFASYRVSGSEQSLSVNLTTGTVLVSAHITGALTNKSGPGTVPSTVDFGTFSGETELTGEQQGFGGIFNYQDFALFAPYEGWFFGPQGKEAAIVAAIRKTDENGVLTQGTFSIAASR